jgi:molybdopterin/thiamine biosynthesis adenylyltransferase
MELTDEQLLRYSRQIMLPQIDVAGQERLLSSSVLVIGLGGLGAPVALYLAAAGIGELTLVDFDTVDLSNLQRQVIHGTTDIGRPKVESAGERLSDINPQCRMEGQLSVFTGEQDSPCYACLYRQEGEDETRCSETGVLAPVVGIIGSIQATEAIKVLLGWQTLKGRLILMDAERMQFREMKFKKDPLCPVCGKQH